jgi:hypothetical protein
MNYELVFCNVIFYLKNFIHSQVEKYDALKNKIIGSIMVVIRQEIACRKRQQY